MYVIYNYMVLSDITVKGATSHLPCPSISLPSTHRNRLGSTPTTGTQPVRVQYLLVHLYHWRRAEWRSLNRRKVWYWPHGYDIMYRTSFWISCIVSCTFLVMFVQNIPSIYHLYVHNSGIQLLWASLFELFLGMGGWWNSDLLLVRTRYWLHDRTWKLQQVWLQYSQVSSTTFNKSLTYMTSFWK